MARFDEATKQEFSKWFNEAPTGRTHMLVVNNTLDPESNDEPIYIDPKRQKDLEIKTSKYSTDGYQIIAQFDLSQDFLFQLEQLDPKPKKSP